jgi:hypothetical protein
MIDLTKQPWLGDNLTPQNERSLESTARSQEMQGVSLTYWFQLQPKVYPKNLTHSLACYCEGKTNSVLSTMEDRANKDWQAVYTSSV